MTYQLTTDELNAETTRFDLALATITEALSGQMLMSQDRCVDGLLDLYNTAPTEVVQAMVVEILDEIRHLSAVKTDDLQARLDQLTVATAVETAFFS